MGYYFDVVKSAAYWRYVLLSRSGAQNVLAMYGGLWLFIESLDFFSVYKRDQYGSCAFIIVLVFAAALAVMLRRPIRSFQINFPEHDFTIVVRIGDIFDELGAVVVSTNTSFESDVSEGRISPDSLQGQFTAKYFTGDQNRLISTLRVGLKEQSGPPYPIGTTVPVFTHGRTFYFVAMAELNEQGNASTTVGAVEQALDSLWSFVRESGELQELVVPLIGTGRGRLDQSRKKMVAMIAESFVRASKSAKFTDRLVIMIRPDDAQRFQVNLYDIKDHLDHTLGRK